MHADSDSSSDDKQQNGTGIPVHNPSDDDEQQNGAGSSPVHNPIEDEQHGGTGNLVHNPSSTMDQGISKLIIMNSAIVRDVVSTLLCDHA